MPRRLALTLATALTVAAGLTFGALVGDHAPLHLALTAGIAVGTCTWSTLRPLAVGEHTYTYRCPEEGCSARMRVTGAHAPPPALIAHVVDHSRH